jgi:hypothetical protein
MTFLTGCIGADVVGGLSDSSGSIMAGTAFIFSRCSMEKREVIILRIDMALIA